MSKNTISEKEYALKNKACFNRISRKLDKSNAVNKCDSCVYKQKHCCCCSKEIQEATISDKWSFFADRYKENACASCDSFPHCMSCINKYKSPYKKYFLILLILLGLILLFRSCAPQSGHVNEGNSFFREGDVEKGELEILSYEETKAKLQEKVDASRFEINMNSSLFLDKATNTYNIQLGNTERNNYSINVDIILDDTNQVVYQSPTLAPGEYIENASFTEALPKGEVTATAVYTIFDAATSSQVGSVNVGILIYTP